MKIQFVIGYGVSHARGLHEMVGINAANIVYVAFSFPHIIFETSQKLDQSLVNGIKVSVNL